MSRAALLALGLLLAGCLDPAWAGVDQAPGVPTVALQADSVGGNELKARWTDLRVSLDTARVGATVPDFAILRGSVFAYRFSNAQADEMFFSIQTGHGTNSATLKPHIHWSPGDQGNEQAGKSVKFLLDCVGGVYGSEFVAFPQVALTDTVTGTDYLHEISDSGTITLTGSLISQVLACRLGRDNTVANNAGAGMFAMELDFHTQIKSLGTVNEDSGGI